MKIISATFAEFGGINAITEDGILFIPADANNQNYADIITQGIIVEPYEPPGPTVPEYISKMQGILALGETRWNSVLQYRETATWSEKVVIDSAADWYRNSQNIAYFMYLLGLDGEETDDLFILASSITV